MGLDYVRDPDEIYRQSFETVRREADLSRFSDAEADVAERLIHACGMVDIINDLAFSASAVAAGVAALENSATIFCDAEMVAAGIIRNRLPAGAKVVCTLNDSRVPERAKAVGNTRSAVAVDFWENGLDGSVAVIGNAPTALFRLLERLDAGANRPALIVGLPVGFVGAAESKAELAANSRGVPFITLNGRRGGSAMASAAVNALAGLAGRP